MGGGWEHGMKLVIEGSGIGSKTIMVVDVEEVLK